MQRERKVVGQRSSNPDKFVVIFLPPKIPIDCACARFISSARIQIFLKAEIFSPFPKKKKHASRRSVLESF